MIYLKNTTDNQIFYIIDKSYEAKSYKVRLADLTVEYLQNGQYSITPPAGYAGISKVNVTVDVADSCNLTTSTVHYTENGEYTITPVDYDGFSDVTVNVEVDDRYDEGLSDGESIQKSKLESTSFTQNGTYTREDGWDTVQVNVDTQDAYNNGKSDQKALLESVTFVSNGTYTREDGWNQVTVNVPSDINNQSKSATYTANGTYTILADQGYSGLSQASVTVNVDDRYDDGYSDGIDNQKAKLTDITIVSNGHYTSVDGYDDITVNIPSDVNNQNKIINPSTATQVITADQGYSGLGQITVNAVTSSIDSDIRPENIKKDVEILGIIGTYDPQPSLESKTVSYSVNGQYSITPSTGYDGLSDAYVTVNVDTQTPYNNGYSDGETAQKAKLTDITITQNGHYTREDGYDDITVNVQCSSSVLYVSPTSIVTDLDGGTYSIGIYSDSAWTISNIPNWITLSQISGNSGITTITVTVSSTNTARSDSFTITDSNFNSSNVLVDQQNPYESQYLTFEATSAGTLYWKQYGSAYTRVLQYSWNGSDWFSRTSTQTNNGCEVTHLSVGEKIMFKSTTSHTVGSSNYHYFVFADGLKGNVYGNIGSVPSPYRLFGGTGVISAENLYVPEGTNCDNLFQDCTSLTTAPVTLPSGHYANMFNGCTRLVNAPELPATTLSMTCYASMFNGCTSLTTAPELPATRLHINCYTNMFRDCTSLTTAPELPATTLQQGCYRYMFMGCSSLNYIKCLATDISSASNPTTSWVYGVSSTGTFIKNPSMTSWTTDTDGIPSGWTVQDA